MVETDATRSAMSNDASGRHRLLVAGLSIVVLTVAVLQTAVVPVLGIISCAYLMLGLPWITWIRFALWLIVGLIVYYSYGFRRSGLRSA